MNIAFLTPEYISDGEFNGGLANYLHKVTHLLKNCGHRSTVIVQSPRNFSWEDNGVFVREVRKKSGLPIVPRIIPSLYKWIGVVNCIFSAKKIEHAFWEQHKKTPFDIVQASSYLTPGLTLVRNGRVPVVCRVSSYAPLWRSALDLPTSLDSVITDYFEIRQASLADSVFAPSEFLVRAFERMAGIRMYLLRSPMFHSMPAMDTAFFELQRPKRPYFLYFGSLNRIKGADLLADALPPFFRHHPEIDIVLIGNDLGLQDGTKIMPHLLQTCGNLSEKLHYFTSMPKSRLYPFVQHALGVLIPSRVDNYPNNCLESQMFSVPVIAAGESSLEEIIIEGVNGFISKNGDAESFLQAMLRCAGMSAEERSAMKKRIIDLNDKVIAEDRIGNLINFYQDVIRRFGKQAR